MALESSDLAGYTFIGRRIAMSSVCYDSAKEGRPTVREIQNTSAGDTLVRLLVDELSPVGSHEASVE